VRVSSGREYVLPSRRWLRLGAGLAETGRWTPRRLAWDVLVAVEEEDEVVEAESEVPELTEGGGGLGGEMRTLYSVGMGFG
jgi:hypothetical protein